MTLLRDETAHEINGVPGRLNTLHIPPSPWVPGVFANQKWISEARAIKGYGAKATLQVEIRFDDNCRNKLMNFAITAQVRLPNKSGIEAGGCLHKEIARVFPGLAPLIKWHSTFTDGPMHYVANTVYLAGDRDHNGLLRGEPRQIKNGKTGELCWRLMTRFLDAHGDELSQPPQYFDGPVPPQLKTETKYVPWLRVGEGKDRQLDWARSAAVWPEATDEQLTAEPEVLKAALLERLPALLLAFRADMEAIGFLWEAPIAKE